MGSGMRYRWRRSVVVLAAFCVLTTTGLASAGTTPRSLRPGGTLAVATGVVLTDRGGRILAANADGSGVKELTGSGAAENPVASPDGAEIAFGENSNVYIMKGDGTGLARLASGAGSSTRLGVKHAPTAHGPA